MSLVPTIDLIRENFGPMSKAGVRFFTKDSLLLFRAVVQVAPPVAATEDTTLKTSAVPDVSHEMAPLGFGLRGTAMKRTI